MMAPLDVAAISDEIHRLLISETGSGVVDASGRIEHEVAQRAPLATVGQRQEIAAAVTGRLSGRGPIEALMSDPVVSEIMINGPGPVWVERGGVISDSGITTRASDIEILIERLIAPTGRTLDPRRPWLDARLTDGSRLNVVAPPIAPDGPCVTIRRFVGAGIGIEAFTDPDRAERLIDRVGAGDNVLVCGPTGSGKTTALAALCQGIDPTQRVITIEDAAELQLDLPHVVRLEARPPTVDGEGKVTIRELVANALRMRPDRLVVGEVRGDEAVDLLHALNTGHRGCLSSIHANGALDALQRLGSLVAETTGATTTEWISERIARSIDLVVEVVREPNGVRRVASVHDVTGPNEVRSW